MPRWTQIGSVDAIRYLVCHHADPDIAASLPFLSARLTREDVEVVTEWRAAALLKHYGHRFPYYLVEEHDWVVPLAGRELQFQLTPYLHFPGAMVSYDTLTRTLFSSDLFGGFVPDNDVLVSDDVDYIIENARPFHQHYMPSHDLLNAGLTRIQQRWPDIAAHRATARPCDPRPSRRARVRGTQDHRLRRLHPRGRRHGPAATASHLGGAHADHQRAAHHRRTPGPGRRDEHHPRDDPRGSRLRAVHRPAGSGMDHVGPGPRPVGASHAPSGLADGGHSPATPRRFSPSTPWTT